MTWVPPLASPRLPALCVTISACPVVEPTHALEIFEWISIPRPCNMDSMTGGVRSVSDAVNGFQQKRWSPQRAAAAIKRETKRKALALLLP